MKKETRILEMPLEIREASNDGETPEIRGTAVVYDAWSEDLGGFVERIAPGAFGDLSNRDLVAQAHHEGGMSTIGRTPKTLAVSDSRERLSYRISPPDTTATRDLLKQIDAGIVTGSSFIFRVKAGGETISEDDDGQITRTVTDAELFEVSPVISPAYPQTDVARRSVERFREERESAAWADENEKMKRANDARLLGMRAAL